jgi:hypothetical protein
MPAFTLDNIEAETTLADALADATFAHAVIHAVADDLAETLADALLFGVVSDNLFRDSQ